MIRNNKVERLFLPHRSLQPQARYNSQTDRTTRMYSHDQTWSTEAIVVVCMISSTVKKQMRSKGCIIPGAVWFVISLLLSSSYACLDRYMFLNTLYRNMIEVIRNTSTVLKVQVSKIRQEIKGTTCHHFHPKITFNLIMCMCYSHWKCWRQQSSCLLLCSLLHQVWKPSRSCMKKDDVLLGGTG